MILVDAKMPKRGCRNCPMNYDIDYCKITHKCVGKEFVEETFPSWCPIKAEIPDNATNGDVIKKLFSSIPPYDVTFDKKWWNAPYRK